MQNRGSNFREPMTQRGQAATKQEKGLGDIKMLWQDDGGKMISKL
jgi:hypothetical protein